MSLSNTANNFIRRITKNLEDEKRLDWQKIGSTLARFLFFPVPDQNQDKKMLSMFLIH